MEPFLTGAAVTGVLAQRLARRLCSNCAEMYQPSADDLIMARVSPDVAAASDGTVFYRKRGCARCGQSGYKGRIGIYQLMVMTEELQTLAATKATREARASGPRDGDADALGRRPGEGRRGPHHGGKARPRDGLIAAECHEGHDFRTHHGGTGHIGVRPRTCRAGHRV